MFKNVGEEIKFVAKIFFVLVVAGAIIAIFNVPEGIDTFHVVWYVLAAILSAWVFSMLIFGFGELIVKVNEIEKNTRLSREKSQDLDEQE